MSKLVEIENLVTDPNFPKGTYAAFANFLQPKISRTTISYVKNNRLKDADTVDGVIKIFSLLVKLGKLANSGKIEKLEELIDTIES